MTSSNFIDPVLSSTIDFDNYIKHHLTSSRKPPRSSSSSSSNAPIHNIHARKTLDDTTTATNRIHNLSRDPQIVPMVNISLQSSMLQVNASRYTLNSTGSTRSEKKQQHLSREKDRGNKGRTAQTAPSSALEPLVLQHSWRAYLKHDGRGDDSIARVDRRSKHLEVVSLTNMASDDELTCEDVPRSYVPTPISAIDEGLLRGATSASVGHIGRSVEEDGWTFSEYRVRLISLKHFFNLWKAESDRLHILLCKRSTAVVVASRLHRLSLILGCWRRHFQSGLFHRAALYRRGISKLLRWRLRSRRRRSIDGYYWVQCRLSLRALMHNRRMELDRQSRRALTLICVRHYQCKLVKTVFLGWKRYSSRVRNEQMLMKEHSTRQDKISSFLSSVRIPHRSSNNHRAVPPKAPLPIPPPRTNNNRPVQRGTLRGDAGDKSIGSTHHLSRTGKPSSDDALSSRSRRNYARRDYAKDEDVQGRIIQTDDAPLSKVVSSGGGDARNAQLSSYCTSAEAQSKIRSCSDVDDQSYSSDEDGGVSTRAPSYDEVMKSANPKDDARSREAADHPPPHHPAPPHHHHRLDAKNRELSMEERHRERKERVALLQRQAEERVLLRNRDKELKERERDMRERDQAEQILRDRRRQLAEERAAKDRSTAAAVEAVRMADSFHSKQLCVRFGLAPWRRYMGQMRLHRLQAQRHYEKHLLHSIWSALLGYIVSVRTTRIRREHRLSSAASSHYAHQLLRRHWKVLKLHHSELKTKLKKLHHHYSSRAKSLRRPFHGWKIAFEHAVRVAVRKYRSIIIPRGDRCVKRHFFQRWLVHRMHCLEEREVSHRINSKWLTVRGWLNS